MSDLMSKHTINLNGVKNARQLGGYLTTDGKTIKQNKLFRTGKLSLATDNDVLKIRDVLGVNLILDLRTDFEISREKDRVIDNVETVNIKILDENGDCNAMVAQYDKSSGTIENLIEFSKISDFSNLIYIDVIYSDYMQKQYRKFFDYIIKNREHSTLYHCTGGKDRTGIATVMLLTVLGVDKQTCLKDFELTNTFMQNERDAMTKRVQAVTDDPFVLEMILSFVGVNVKFMENLFIEAEKHFGSMFNFIKEKIGLTDNEIEQLKSSYLE